MKAEMYEMKPLFNGVCNKSRPVEISENLIFSLMSISLTLSLAKTQGSVYVRLNRILLSYYLINTGK